MQRYHNLHASQEQNLHQQPQDERKEYLPIHICYASADSLTVANGIAPYYKESLHALPLWLHLLAYPLVCNKACSLVVFHPDTVAHYHWLSYSKPQNRNACQASPLV